MFNLTITPMNIIGIILTLLGGAWYASVEYAEKKQSKSRLTRRGWQDSQPRYTHAGLTQQILNLFLANYTSTMSFASTLSQTLVSNNHLDNLHNDILMLKVKKNVHNGVFKIKWYCGNVFNGGIRKSTKDLAIVPKAMLLVFFFDPSVPRFVS